jgi:hypothetical protein
MRRHNGIVPRVSSSHRPTIGRIRQTSTDHSEPHLTNLVFATGAFSSGSTLLFTLLRKTGDFHCLYEPLHQRLREHLRAGLRVYEHHYHVDNYFAEYRGFSQLESLFDPAFGQRGLSLSAADDNPELYRYLSYLIGTSFGRRPNVLLKFNRVSFRLPWLRHAFPRAKVIHIYRDRDSQWNSIVQRSQAFFGKQDVEQDKVTFNGMNIASWCDDLAPTYPELAAGESGSGYERFSKLWALSLREGRAHADLTIQFEDLTSNFDEVCGQIWHALGLTSNYLPLKQWVVAPEQRTPLKPRPRTFGSRLVHAGQRARFEYAKFRVRVASREKSPK